MITTTLQARFGRYLVPLAFAGAIVAVAQVVRWFSLGAWPPHDTANIWLAGAHLRGGEPVYSGTVGEFLVFVYSPPIAVLAVPWSLLPVEVLSIVLLAAQILAFRWVAGSWKVVGLLCWLPVVPASLSPATLTSSWPPRSTRRRVVSEAAVGPGRCSHS